MVSQVITTTEKIMRTKGVTALAALFLLLALAAEEASARGRTKGRKARKSARDGCDCDEDDEERPTCTDTEIYYYNPCEAECDGERVECDDDVDEVCGDDGETYSNRCHAKCFRVGVKCKGRCPCDGGDSSVSRPDSLDTDEVERCEQKCDEDEPTCGRDGKEYNSPCHARCHGVKAKCSGKRKMVCGRDGNNHPNECVASCRADTRKACDGKCPCKDSNGSGTSNPEPCECRGSGRGPVCGSDGRDYDSECDADCNGARVHCEGRCPCNCERCHEKGYRPACGKDRRTGKNTAYDNVCELYCKGADYVCDNVYKPTCATDGNTYPNGCHVRCFSETIACVDYCPCDGRGRSKTGRSASGNSTLTVKEPIKKHIKKPVKKSIKKKP